MPYPTPIKRHLDHLPLHLGQTSLVGILAEKCPTTTGGILTAKALFAIARSPIFHHSDPLTMRTHYRFNSHRSLSPLGSPLPKRRKVGDTMTAFSSRINKSETLPQLRALLLTCHPWCRIS